MSGRGRGVRRWAWLAVPLAAGCTLAHNALTSRGPEADVPTEMHDAVAEDVRIASDVGDGFDVLSDGPDVLDALPPDAGIDAADSGLDAQDASDDNREADFDAPVVEAPSSTGARGQPCTGGTLCSSPSDVCTALGGGDTVCRACGAPGEPCCDARMCPGGGTPADEATGLGSTVCLCTRDDSSVAGGYCSFGLCSSGLGCGAGFRCVECGELGDPCCFLGACASGHCGTTPALSQPICR